VAGQTLRQNYAGSTYITFQISMKEARLEAGILIRPFVETDVDAVHALLVSCYRWLARQEDWSDIALRTIMAARSSRVSIQSESQVQSWIVACAAGRLVGMAAVNDNEIAKLYVDPEAHRQGVGSRLFAEAVSLIERDGHRTATLGSAESAVPFWLAMGAAPIGQRAYSLAGFQDRNVVVMERKLSIPEARPGTG